MLYPELRGRNRTERDGLLREAASTSFDWDEWAGICGSLVLGVALTATVPSVLGWRTASQSRRWTFPSRFHFFVSPRGLSLCGGHGEVCGRKCDNYTASVNHHADTDVGRMVPWSMCLGPHWGRS